jgi:hypothetical protein
MIFSFIVLALTIVMYLRKKYSFAAFLYFLPFFAAALSISVGPVNMPIWAVTSIFVVIYPKPKVYLNNLTIQKKLRFTTKPLFLFIFVSLFIFIVIGNLYLFEAFPEGNNRLWSQRYYARALISSSRFLISILAIYSSVIIFFTIGYKKALKILYNVGLFVGIYAIINFLTSGLVNKIVFFDTQISFIERVSGMSGEPRHFAQALLVMSIIAIIDYTVSGEKRSLVSFILFFIFILLSLSASATTALIVCSVYLVVKSVKISKRLILAVLPISLVFLIIAGLIFNQNKNKSEIMSSKIASVLAGKKNIDVNYGDNPFDYFPLFSRFEVFDRAALNFLFYNSEYLLTGTGPNTVSIPASNYIDSYSQKIYADTINSVPHNGFVNIFASGGLIGVIIYCIFFIRLARVSALNNNAKLLAQMSFVIFMIVNPPALWVLYALALYESNNSEQ